MRSLRFFWGSLLGLFIALVLGFVVGNAAGGPAGGVSAVITVLLLCVLETSLSFDNAVVNAAVLKGWNERWRKLFLWIGLPIGVFGMRLVFPVLIVSIATGLGMVEAFRLAIDDPGAYALALSSAHHEIAAFGGVFLLMVAFEFFMDEEKKRHWVPFIERLLARLGSYEKAVGAGATLSLLLLASLLLPMAEQHEFIVAGVLGLIAYVGTKLLGGLLGSPDAAAGQVIVQGVGGLLFLEVRDASFSFDGVVGAFAISTNIWIIMLGLGVGALFVRSLTIYLVNAGTLDKYAHLEHGAFWAILALALLMFLNTAIEVPELITGLIGAAFVGLSVYTSLKERAKA